MVPVRPAEDCTNVEQCNPWNAPGGTTPKCDEPQFRESCPLLCGTCKVLCPDPDPGICGTIRAADCLTDELTYSTCDHLCGKCGAVVPVVPAEDCTNVEQCNPWNAPGGATPKCNEPQFRESCPLLCGACKVLCPDPDPDVCRTIRAADCLTDELTYSTCDHLCGKCGTTTFTAHPVDV